MCETTPAVTADIEPVGAPVVIAASGGSLSYTVTLTNTTASAQVVTAEISATLPNGSTFGPVQGPQTVPVAASGSIGPITFTEAVPGAAPAGTYTLTLTLTSGGEEVDADSFTFEKATSAASRAEVAFGLAPVYPNPVREAATVEFALSEAGTVRLTVYDLLGREVAVLADGTLDAGFHTATLGGAGLPSGTYLVRLSAAGQVETQRVTVVR
ncbi:MAG: T9SS type A sorting domain-containing protein [Bacteroidota bacterium]